MITHYRVKTQNPKHIVYQPLTVNDVCFMLKQWPPDTKVYVDFDHDGGNENQAREVKPFEQFGQKGVKIE